MKRYVSTCCLLVALLIVTALVFWRESRTPGRLRCVQIDGPCWDDTTVGRVDLTIQIDDEQTLAQVKPWRHWVRATARKKALQELWPPLRRSPCENALRQGLERVTLVYEDGHREELGVVNIYATPFRHNWAESKSALTTLLLALRWMILTFLGFPHW
jgi:hypothetical protein